MDDNNAMVEFSLGKVPSDKDFLRSITVGLDKVSSFIDREYLKSYIKEGGSKIKFITGKKGAGKTHLTKLLSFAAEDDGYIVVELDSRDLLLSDLTFLYLEILKRIDFDDLVKRSAINMVRSLGYDYSADCGKKFRDWLSDSDSFSFYRKQELRDALESFYHANPNLDYNFGQVVSFLASVFLGEISTNKEAQEISKKWLYVEKDLKLSQLRNSGLAGYKINKLNARVMIKSIAELVHLAGYNGLFVSIDNLDSLISSSSLNPVKYTKMKRDDAYEAIRELIDDIDVFKYFFLVFSFNRSLIDNEKNGIKSYQALWLRIQNEIVSSRVNLYTDLLDLDKINSFIYTEQSILEMNERQREMLSSYHVAALQMTEDKAKELLKEAKYGGVSLPLLVNRFTFERDKKENEENGL